MSDPMQGYTDKAVLAKYFKQVLKMQLNACRRLRLMSMHEWQPCTR